MHNTFPAACAIISSNYLSDGRVVASSYLKHHPGAHFYLLVVDGHQRAIDAGPGVRIIHPEELNSAHFAEMCFKYSPTELCCALKPTLLNLLLTRYNEEQVIYFDSDILVMRRLEEVTECLHESSIVLTPHLLEPIPLDGLTPSEQDILVAGAHNLGFIAIRKSDSTHDFLAWWEQRLHEGGFIEFSQGLLTDQRWVDLVPSLFPATLLKDETYNVAYWNIHSRRITREGDTFFVNKRKPVAFFHFSGFDPTNPDVLSKHQNRTPIEKGTGLADLIRLYVDLQVENGLKTCRAWKYGFSSFDDGTGITAPMRRAYSRLDQSQRTFFGDPFRTSANSFFRWATRHDGLSRGLSPFLKSLYELRPDVAAAFPDINGKDREVFLRWAATDGATEYKYDPVVMRVKPETAAVIPHMGSRGPKCSIIIPVYNNTSLTLACLKSVLERTRTAFEIETIVVNDGSTDETAAFLEAYGTQLRVVSHDFNCGFATSCNDAAAIATGEYLIFLNNDTIPEDGWLDALVRYADAHPEAAVVGSKLLFPNRTVQHAGIMICADHEPRHIYAGFPADDPHVNRSRRYQAVTAACLLIRQTDFAQAGGLDKAFRNGYEDVDLCLRLGEIGREVHYCHESVLIHLESASRDASKTRDHLQNSKLYRERWAGRVRPDEFEFYVQDEVLKIDYRPLYPIAFSISPSLATVNGVDRERQADRLIQARANQVIGLLRDNIRLTITVREVEFRLQSQKAGPRSVAPIRPEEVDPSPIQPPRIVSQGPSLWLSERSTNRVISIILPVKNGAAKLREMLPALLSQKIRDLVEIVAIDSASTDESVELLKEANASVIGIDPRTFNHGLTRNLATKYAHGTIYVFMNQSTLPAHDQWLANLVRPFDFDSSLAGVCGRVLPRPDADWLNGKDIARNINATTERVVTKITDRDAYASLNPESLRLFVNFHSLSAAIRADVFKQIPFREANFAEDLIWGKEALEAGYTIQFEPSSVALHSHNYSILDVFRRNFDDGAACRRICGRTLDARNIGPGIMHEVRDDWRYLTEQCHLEGDELEHWKLVSVMRRTAQLFGHWIGVHYKSAEQDAAGLASILSITEQIKAGAKTEQPEEFIAHARSAG
jgi:GT2 family glycosyltransferase